MKKMFFLLALLSTACHTDFGDEPPNYQTMKESRPIGNVKELAVQLNYDVGKLDVRSDSGDDLFSFDLEYDERRSTPEFNFSGGERATMRLEMDHRFRIDHGRRSNDLVLRLTDRIPLNLDFTSGVSEAHLDMTNLDISRLHLRGGVGKTEVTFDKPAEVAMSYFEVESGVGNLTVRGLGNARVGSLKVKGGVGRTDLDFTGEIEDTSVDGEIDVGVGQVRLLLPRNANITIEAEGSFLSNISAPSFRKDNNHYYYEPAEGGGPRVVLRVRSGIGGVTVELI